ncbi:MULTISPECIES: DUF3160 domain-containing protein [unclassified Methanosarcina]|uniref:DUF3160 domain-containing protein n=1 Tax=unclassified Methanosarcina TaxID=2644672 RepID=UPI0006155751|nr:MULTISPECIES: DUF3160 domain-containing protein [unclassified Methanosarcina]AKB18297.1 dTDP-D-glucose 4,6-dehydratase [Methanosarcina sp. WWM596]AKB21616.1 dTDP-D-glucose 4,6-dehydratase [Methanosarcina sp. WH1]
MDPRTKFVSVYLMLLLFVFFAGCSGKDAGQDTSGYTAGVLKTEAVIYSRVLGQGAYLPINYSLEALDVELKAPSYELPLEMDKISNYAAFSGRIPLDESALEMLENNGFVVIENPYDSSEEDITSMYVTLKEEEIPVFITTDSLLHLYHIQFDETLRQIEEKEFYDTLWETDLALLNSSVEEYNSASNNVFNSSSDEEKEAARRNAAYFAVALNLLQPKPSQVQAVEDPYGFVDEALFPTGSAEKYHFEVPSFVKEEVEAELALIEAHGGFATSPIFKYEEDYSQYVPRGHYTRSEKLQNYFRAFMWHGRMSMLLKDRLIESKDPAKDARIQTIQGSRISSRLENSPELLENWDRIYGVTAFYVGFSDDLGPYEYIEAMDQVFDNGERKFNETAVEELKAVLAENQGPQIYGGTGNCILEPPFTPEQADECLENTTGFRFMGQRFIPDSYMFSNLVGAYTGEYQGERDEPFTYVISGAGRPIRGFPRGLDAMALLGSKRAVYWLDELNDSSYENYSVRYEELDSELSNFSTAEWNRNLYWSWLYSLQPLLKDHGEGYPTFMQTDAWQDKELSTSLASWTELRHDTILYAKQSYTIVETSMPMPPEEKPVVGYVEPVPDFYARLLALTKMTNQGLDEMGVLDPTSKTRLTYLETIISRLQAISEKELKNEELTEEDYEFIKNFGDQLDGVIADVDEKARKTTVVADVHTDGNTENVLEEGVGYVDMLVVAYKLPDDRILIGAGPVFSYYEFKQPMSDRLTDEKWREMLEANPPKRPEWASTYIS